MRSVTFVLVVLTACAVKQICSIRIDNMDDVKNRIDLKDPDWSYDSSGILKSHSGLSFTTNRNKTVILSAPYGYSIFAAIRLLDLRPEGEDNLILSANKTAGPVRYSNNRYIRNRIFDSYENTDTYYAPDGQLAVTFSTGPSYITYPYDGFELIYTVQANWSNCATYNFWCSNARCVSKSFKCDGHNHCGDRSDQSNCFIPDPIPPRSARTGGIVAGIVFFIIALICAVYIIIRRNMRRKLVRRTVVSQHPPPTDIPGGYPPPYNEPGVVYPPPPPPYSPYNQGIVNPVYQ